MNERDVSVKVEGLRELRRTLKAAGDDLADLKAANQAAGRIVLNAARPDTPRRTGRLAASGRAGKAAGKATVVFGSARLPYAPIQHWGWPARHIEARPWVTAAARDSQGEWLEAYEQDVQRVLDRVRGT